LLGMMLSCISLRTAFHHTISIHFNFLASHCTAPFSTTLATLALRGFLAHHHPSSRPQQPPTSSRPSSRPPAAAHQQPPTSSRPPAAAHSSRPSIFSLISRPFYPPMAARGGLGGFLPYYRSFQSFSSYLDHIRGLRLTGGLSRRLFCLYGGL
jgi:hypothetical protein